MLTTGLINKWSAVTFETSTMRTVQFSLFAREYKRGIKEELAQYGMSIHNYSVNHFEVSGFIKHPTKDSYVYFHVSDVRYWPGAWHNHILIRTAMHLKDYMGGRNNYTSLETLAQDAQRLLG